MLMDVRDMHDPDSQKDLSKHIGKNPAIIRNIIDRHNDKLREAMERTMLFLQSVLNSSCDLGTPLNSQGEPCSPEEHL